MKQELNPELVNYIETEIIPRYDAFDKAHRRDHARSVIAEALRLAEFYPVDLNLIYAAAAFHDTGLIDGREEHHLSSGRIIRQDDQLPRWFSAEEMELMAQAAEDHRASGKKEPRSLYGKIVAEADRDIIPLKIIRRTIQFGLEKYPRLCKEEHWQHTVEHMQEKYAEGGYLKLWIPESPNAARLEELRAMFRDRLQFREIFEDIFAKETGAAL